MTKVLDQRISPLSLQLADRLVATDPRLVATNYRSKVRRVVTWGVNSELFSPLSRESARETLELPAKGHVLTYVGSFKRWHDVLTLVRAVDILGRRDLRVLMVGEGPLRRSVIGLARKRGVRDQFLLPGAQPYATVPTWLAAADICIAPFDPQAHPPSRRLGFSLDPLKVLESMAMARPTVTVDSANIRKLLEPERHALLVPPRDPTQLAAAIGSLLDAPRRRLEMGNAARAHIVDRHTWTHHIRELEDIFEEVRS
ncbi:MAG: glycosyltransferase family 4 protein [Nannocystaceae bacterium]|nr:glycosyltransferase family 4 protein [Nannocystaceae bacterium]